MKNPRFILGFFLPLNTNMSFVVQCYTLFDITQTGVMNRNRPSVDEDHDLWLFRRNTQCNFDTILQAISLRSQPENITTPTSSELIFTETELFGFLLESENPVKYWKFSFSIHHPSVFYDGISELGSLYSDCESVPMIKTKSCWDKLPNFLDTSDEMRNIYFKVLEHVE